MRHSWDEDVKRFREGLVFKAHRLLHHSTLGSRAIKKKEKDEVEGVTGVCGGPRRAWPSRQIQHIDLRIVCQIEGCTAGMKMRVSPAYVESHVGLGQAGVQAIHHVGLRYAGNSSILA